MYYVYILITIIFIIYQYDFIILTKIINDLEIHNFNKIIYNHKNNIEYNNTNNLISNVLLFNEYIEHKINNSISLFNMLKVNNTEQTLFIKNNNKIRLYNKLKDLSLKLKNNDYQGLQIYYVFKICNSMKKYIININNHSDLINYYNYIICSYNLENYITDNYFDIFYNKIISGLTNDNIRLMLYEILD